MKMKKLAVLLAAVLAVSGPVQMASASEMEEFQSEDMETAVTQMADDSDETDMETPEGESDSMFTDEAAEESGEGEDIPEEPEEIQMPETVTEVPQEQEEITEENGELLPEKTELQEQEEIPGENAEALNPGDDISEAGSSIIYGDSEYSWTVINKDEIELLDYKGSLEDLTIPSYLDGKKVTALGRDFLRSNHTVKTLRVPGTITYCEIYTGEYWAEPLAGPLAYSSVRKVIFEEGMKYIPSYICCRAVNLEEVEIPPSVNEIGGNVFNYCSLLTDVELPMKKLKLICGGVFAGTAVTTVRLPIIEPDPDSNLRSSNVFYGSNVSTVYMAEGQKIIPMEFFKGAEALKNVYIPDSVTEIRPLAFSGCTALEELDLPEELTTIGKRFIEKTLISELVIPPKVTTVAGEFTSEYEGAFTNAEKLKKIKIADGATTIPKGLAQRSPSLTEVQIPDTVRSIGYAAFCECRNLQEFEFPKNIEELGPNMLADTGIRELKVPGTVKKATSALSNMTSLEKVVFEKGITELSESICSGNTNLKTVELPEGLKKIKRDAFFLCTSLTELKLPYGLTLLGKGFIYGAGVTEISIPATVTEFGEDGNNCFTGAMDLKYVRLEDGTKKIPPNAFEYGQFEKITIPESVSEIGTWAFYECYNLKTIDGTLPDNIGNGAFYECKALEEVVIRKTEDLFKDASEPKLEDAENSDPEVHKLKAAWNISESKGKALGGSSFYRCYALKRMTIPATISSVKDSYCWTDNSIQEIIFTGTEEQWKKVADGNNGIIEKTKCTGTDKSLLPTGFEIQISTTKDFEKFQSVRLSYQDAYSSSKEADFSKVITADEKVKTYYMRIRSLLGAGKDDAGNSIVYNGKWTDTVTCDVKNIVTAQDVKESVEKFYKVLDNYLADLKTDTEGKQEDYQSTATKGELLMNADDGSMVVWTSTTPPTDIQKLAVYEALAQYMDEASGLTIGKLSSDTSKASQQIIKAVYENLISNSGEKIYHTSAGNVVLNLTGEAISEKNALTGKTEVRSAFGGSAKLNGKIVAAVSSGKSGKVMLAFIKDMRATVNDLMYQSLSSVFTELLKVTQISQFTKDSTKEWLDGLTSGVDNAINKDLKWGNLRKILTNAWNGCKTLNKIKSASKPKDLKEALKNAKDIWKYVDGLDMSDTAIKSALMKSATAELENQRKDLAKTLYCYLYQLEKEDASSTAGKVVQKIRKYKANCPVDITIYNSSGTQIGSVKNGRASFQPEITLLVRGSTKEFWLSAAENYKIVFTGTDTGTMDYTIQQREDHKFVTQIDYFDVPLAAGKVYEQTVYTGGIWAGDKSMDLVSYGKRITSTSHTDKEGNVKQVKVGCTAADGGTFSGDLKPAADAQDRRAELTAEQGTVIHLKAEAAEGYQFTGWYQDNVLKSALQEYYFAAVKDTELEARFKKSTVYDNSHSVVIGEDYSGKAGTELTKTQLKIEFFEELPGQPDSINVVLKRYLKINGTPVTESGVLKKQEDSSYCLEGFDAGAAEKIEILDEQGSMIAVIYAKDQMPSYSCGDGNHDMVSRDTWSDCLKKGVHTETCSICNMQTTTEIPAKNSHTFGTWKITRAATAVKAGVKVRSCSVCKKKETGTVSKLKATGKLNMTVIYLKAKQSTTALKVSGLAKGDYVKSYRISGSSIASVSTKGKITAKKKGNTYLTVTLASGKTLKAKIVVQSGNVATQKITVDRSQVTLKVKKTCQLKVSRLPLTSLEKVIYTSSDKKVAVVSSTGKITAKKAGKATITIKAGKKKITVKVTVKK